MGIIETGKNYCIVKEMGETTPKEFDNSFRRIFLVILQMFERILEAIKKDEINDPGLCKEIQTIDLNVDRFVDYCCRIINKTNAFPENKKVLLFSTLYLLELLGDEFKYIGKHIAFSKKSIKEVMDIAEMIKEHFETYYRLFYKFDRESAIRLGKNDFEVYSKYFEIKEKLQKDSRNISQHFIVISKFILSLAELKIEMEF